MSSMTNSATKKSLLGVLGLGVGASFAAVSLEAALPKTVKIAEFDATGKRKGVSEVPTVVKTDAEWHKLLDTEQFNVTRKADTEYPFTGKYWNKHDDGLY